MIDTNNLRTASLYINNQLLSRGLLRDGQSINFADPTSGDGDLSATMGRIMSIVNDLILRRDKDAEHRETLSTTMRSIRAENLQQVKDISTLTEKAAEAKRKLELAEASEAALKTQLKSAEAAARGLKEEVFRTKALVSQARASCATEVRRRDRQIDNLKKQLGEAGRARGARPNPAITTIHITGDVRSEKGTPMKGENTSVDTYPLRDETNVFLANLAQNLSEENETILSAMRRTMVQLREMSGFSSEENSGRHVVKQAGWEEMSSELDSVLDHMKTILTNPSFVPIEEVMIREEEIARLKDGWVKMEDRWKDAVLLIDSWRKRMAASGKPVDEKELMMSLRLSPAKPRREVEAQHCADFGLSAVAEEDEESVMQREGSPCPSNPESLHLVPAEAYQGHPEDDLESSAEMSAPEDDVLTEEYDVEEPNFEVLQESTAQPELNSSLDSPPLPEPPQLTPLRNSNTAGNRGLAQNPMLRKPQLAFTSIAEEKAKDIAAPVPATKPPVGRHRVQSSKAEALATETAASDEKHRAVSTSSLDEVLLARSTENTEPEPTQNRGHLGPGLMHTPRRGPSRLPLPRNPEPQQSPLTMATIAAKLAASEKEADAARVRAKLRAARAARPTQKQSLEVPRVEQPVASEEGEKQADAGTMRHEAGNAEDAQTGREGGVGAGDQEVKPEKRKRERRTSKVASRRRSTLSPLELQSLISGTAQ